MPICPECYSYIDRLVPAQIYDGLMCPVCRTVLVDDLNTLQEWLDGQDEEI